MQYRPPRSSRRLGSALSKGLYYARPQPTKSIQSPRVGARPLEKYSTELHPGRRREIGRLPAHSAFAGGKWGQKKLWHLLHTEDYVPTLGTFTGNQAVQQIKAGLKAIYLSGWQVAADANNSGNMYPDQSLYPADSVPAIVKRINKALQRADQIQTMEKLSGEDTTDYDFFLPQSLPMLKPALAAS